MLVEFEFHDAAKKFNVNPMHVSAVFEQQDGTSVIELNNGHRFGVKGTATEVRERLRKGS